MCLKSTNFDILKSYYLTRLIDLELMKTSEFSRDVIENAIKAAERQYQRVDFIGLEQRLK